MTISPTLLAALQANIGRADPSLAGEFVVLFEVERFDLTMDSLDIFYAATGGYVSSPVDALANRPYHARLKVPKFTQSIFGGANGWRRSTGAIVSEIEVFNIDGRLDAEIDADTYSWKGRRATLLGGLMQWNRSQFEVLPGGNLIILDIYPGEDSVIFKVASLTDRPDRPMQKNYYGGFGNAYNFDSAADVTLGSTYNLGARDATLSIRFKLTSTGAAVRSLYQKRTGTAAAAGNAGYASFFSAGGVLTLYLDDGTNFFSQTVGSAGLYLDGVTHQFDAVIKRSTGRLITYVDGVAVTNTDISAVTGNLTNAVAYHHGATTAGGQNFSGSIDEPRVWLRALSANEIKSGWLFAVDGVEDGLVGAWPYNNIDSGVQNIVKGPAHIQAQFNGSINCSMGNIADPGTAHFSVAGWFSVAPGAGGVLVSRRASGLLASVGYAVHVTSGDVVFEASDGSTLYSATVSGSYDDGTFYGFAASFVPGENALKLWVLNYPRGTLTAATPADTTGTGTFGGGSTNFKLGEYDGGTNRLTGRLSWVLYVPLALDETAAMVALSDQVAPIINEMMTQPPQGVEWVNTSGAHWWPLNENTGSTAVDYIGTDDGTFSSAPTWIDRDGDLTPGGSSGLVPTLSGGVDMKGLPKPVCLGFCGRVRPVLLEPTVGQGLYQFSDPALGPCNAVHQVKAGAKPLTLTTDYTVNLTDNTVTLVTAQDAIITMDIQGVKSGGVWLRYPGEIVAWAWENMVGIDAADIDTDSVAAYDALHHYESGLFLGTDELIDFERFHELMLAPDGFAYRAAENKMALQTRVDPGTLTPVLTLNDNDIDAIEPIAVPPPSWLIRLGYDRTWWTSDSFEDTATPSAQQLSVEPFRYVQDSRLVVLDKYPDALPRAYATVFHRRWDAARQVQRLFKVDSVPHAGWRITLGAQHWSAALGNGIAIFSYSRYQHAGKRLQVLGYENGMDEGLPVTILLAVEGVPA